MNKKDEKLKIKGSMDDVLRAAFKKPKKDSKKVKKKK